MSDAQSAAEFVSDVHVLIVDDDTRLRQLLSSFLSINGYRTSVAADTEEADKILSKGGVSLVVLDVMMPGEDGIQYTKRLPVHLPALQDTAIGGFWSGSPYLGHAGPVPPGEGGLNPWNGFTYPWHSHHVVEGINNDVFPGGNLTLFVVVPPDAPFSSGL